MSITLSGGGAGGPQPFTDSVKDLKGNDGTFTKALVTHGQWIMYKHKNYNDEVYGGSAEDILVLEKGANVDISSHNGSMYLVPADTSALVLFKHVYYGGVNPDPRVCNYVNIFSGTYCVVSESCLKYQSLLIVIVLIYLS
jgi:hypothetical protein